MAKKKAKKPGITVHCKYDKLLKTDSLKPHPANPATHSDEQVTLLAKIMKSHGIRWPIVVSKRSGFIVAGHCRRRAAMMLGVEYPIVFQDYTDENEELAVLVADNKIAELSGVDGQVMADVLVQLDQVDYPLELTAIPEAEIHDYIVGPLTPNPLDDVVPDPPKKPKTKLGDIYILGEHRLICGDATDSECVKQLLAGHKPFMMVTDPPYGVKYDPKWRNVAAKKGSIGFAKRREADVRNDDRMDWSEAYNLFGGDVIYLWHAGRYSVPAVLSLEACGFEVRTQIIWRKPRFVISRGHYHYQHEPCWYAVRKGRTACWCGDRSQTTIWDIAQVYDDTDKTHATQKPIECMIRPIKNHGKSGDIVYDPFLGTGTSLVAAEKLSRKCYGIEIDPIYCDVIVKRWEGFTGKTAKRQRKR